MRSPSWEDDFTSFVVARSTSLLRTAYLLTGDRGTAEDLLQTALVKAYRKWPSVRRREAADAYVRRILVTTHLSWRRRHWVNEVPTHRLPERAGADDADGRLERTTVWQALRSLPPKQRAVMVLRYYEDLTEAQIATVLNCSTGAVKTHASRAAARLREELSGTPDDVKGGAR